MLYSGVLSASLRIKDESYNNLGCVGFAHSISDIAVQRQCAYFYILYYSRCHIYTVDSLLSHDLFAIFTNV